MDRLPLFSVLMPSFQRAAFVERAVHSVRAQTCTDWELLVADDGSTDDTAARLVALARDEPRLRWWRHPNQGQALARNGLLEHARGRWITFLDSDDALAPGHLALRAEAIARATGLELILAPMQVIGDAHVRCRHGAEAPVHVDDCLAVGMLCVRADLLRAAGGFPRSAYGEDAELIDALLARCTRQVRLVERSYQYFRDHGGGLTAQRGADPGPGG